SSTRLRNARSIFVYAHARKPGREDRLYLVRPPGRDDSGLPLRFICEAGLSPSRLRPAGHAGAGKANHPARLQRDCPPCVWSQPCGACTLSLGRLPSDRSKYEQNDFILTMPLSPTATRDLLAQLGHQPKRFLGQNFLVDGNIVRKSLELAGVRAGDTVVEIGPGLGTLTEALLEAGANVWAVEKDRTLHQHLTETLLPRFPTTFHLLEGDAVEHPLAGLPADSAA